MDSRASRWIWLMFAASAFLPFAGAQEYPSKPIRLIVPTTPATTPDLAARIVGPALSKVLGQPVVVENRAGADMMVGFEYVAKQAPADGYTIVCAIAGNLAILPTIVKDLRFDPLRDLPPVIGFAEGRLAFVSPLKAPWKTFNEMVAYAKANPGKLNYGTSAPNMRLMTEVVRRRSGFEAVHVPYSGGAQWVQAIAAGNDVQIGFLSDTLALTLRDKVHALAITGTTRSTKLPDTPTFTELGLPKMPGINFSLNVRAGTPLPIIQKLYASASTALQSPDVKAALEKANFIVVDETPEAAARTLAEQAAFFADVAKQVGVEPK